MRVAVGGYLVAVNTFVEQRMGLELFQKSVVAGDALLNAGSGDSAIYGFLEGARQRQWDAVPLQFMFPGVGGKATRDAHEWAKDRFLTQLRQAGPVDGIFIQLHGTGAAEHLDDCEGDLLAAIREAVGDKVVLMASLDGHANVTPLMVEQTDLLIGVKTNPHYDFVPVGRKAAQVMAGMFDGSLSPTMVRAQPAMSPALQKLYIAPGWPMEHLMRQAQNLAASDGRILDVSLLEGFFCSEIPETGMSVVVTTDGEPNLAQDVAEQIKQACWAKRQSFHTDMVSVEEAVREAMATEVGPVIWAIWPTAAGPVRRVTARRFWPSCSSRAPAARSSAISPTPRLSRPPYRPGSARTSASASAARPTGFTATRSRSAAGCAPSTRASSPPVRRSSP